MSTIQSALQQAWKQLEQRGIAGGRLDAELLMAHVLNVDRAHVLAHSNDELPEGPRSAFQALIQRRLQHEPVVHLTGTREFYGLQFAISPDVLTPRVETEQMVEWALKYAPQASALIDIGTGSGAIAIAIAAHRPDLQVTGTEISPAAIQVAQQNVVAHNVSVNLVLSDLWDPLPSKASAQKDVPPIGRYATIVTNLPYLRDDARAELMPEVQREPAVALFGGSDGLDLYRRFLDGLPQHLLPGGYLFTECDPWQHDTLIKEAARVGLTPIEQGYFILGFRAAG